MRFFTYETQLPKDVGFSLFGSVHLAWLVGISAFTILAALWFSQRPAYRQRRISWAVAASPLVTSNRAESTGRLSRQSVRKFM